MELGAAAQRDLDQWIKAAHANRETREALAEDWPDLAAHADKALPSHRCPAVGCMTRLPDDRAYCGAHTRQARGRVTDCGATYPAYSGAIGNGCHEIVEDNDWLCARHRKQL